ncbi:HD family phosphohydrolase [Owenweeksia hongkongensis]|uniref:Putative domain HDIG-containing protein n=1 Tax=Owenweeksia hongkongensis (strain DSM 17368 / CIP 108786 / JCM 12287 / NRRL B-23963 / UST20020801) TaxID=926562 RepID=G8R4J5_OWEHD|nr:HDIG domain-containing metalloprotein [Owenweeksia hongkongensis]AEV32084.1 putative domain HDIG-containing protein [Owenweeksia hongkongensis DSM 17368]
MKKLLLYLQNHQTRFAGLVLFAISIALVVYINPREVKFKYEFQKGKPWLYENLVAPFDFPVLKTDEELEKERKSIVESKTMFLRKDDDVAEDALIAFEDEYKIEWNKIEAVAPLGKKGTPKVKDAFRRSVKNTARDLLGEVYQKGVLKPVGDDEGKVGEVLITVKGVSSPARIQDFHSISTATSAIRKAYADSSEAMQDFIIPILLSHLDYNVFYDEKLSGSYLKSQLEGIVPTRGIVQEGELIIFKGNIIDDEKFAKLNSLRKSYEGSYSGQYSFYFILSGQILQIGLLFSVLFVFLTQFRKQIMEDVSKLTFILINVLMVVGLCRVVLDFGVTYIYLVPFTILPITLRSFFDTRLALFVHMMAILLCGLMLPNSFEFVFLQFVAGVFSVVLVNNLYKRSQLFFTAAKIILVYCISYFSMAIIQEGSLQNLEPLHFAFFAGNGFLTLMSFPLIYFQEKIFGFVSDVSLLELSDTNNPLLRRLGQEAPGTFQHSMQVANLAEAAVLKINGNALLVRTGALYHDIGKLTNPMYFIENQSTGLNPHDELSFEESAEIIIKHVRDGIKLAKKNNLPDILIDFIRTHHGTSTVMYFYKQYIKNFPEEEVDLEKFTYPGPKPFSKETAALMMADSVEAASRSLDKPDHDKIDALVENIIDHQVDTGQFENAEITLREIKEIKKIFKKLLMNIYHVRVQYPE